MTARVAREVVGPVMVIGGRGARIGGAGPASIGYSAVARLWMPGCSAPQVAPDDPAVLLITDFTRKQPWTITEERSIDDALRDMVCAGVQALLVVRAGIVTGLITCCDIQGQRPSDLTTDSNWRVEMHVGNVMTKSDRIPTLAWRSVCGSRVRQIEQWVRNTRATYALVIEHIGGTAFVRGLLSRTSIEHALGRSL